MSVALAREIAAEHVAWALRRGDTHMDIAASVEWAPHLWPTTADLTDRLAREWMKTQPVQIRRIA